MIDLHPSPFLRRVCIVLACFALLLFSFSVGMNIGERKAHHVNDWCKNYPNMIPSSHQGMDRRMPLLAPPLPGGHGVFGKILSINGNQFVIQGQNQLEENVVINSSTVIRVGQQTIRWQDIPADLGHMDVAVFGTPTQQGQIEARLIRLFVRP